MGLSYAQQRWYEPGSGRFLSEDPVFGDPTQPNSMHVFGYANGNPLINIDPEGEASRQQYKRVLTVLLDKIASGNRTAAGTAAEVVLERMLQNAGHIVIKGPATNSGAHYADVVTFDPSSGELLFFDNKAIADKKLVSRAEAFKQSRRAEVIADAERKFLDIADTLPREHVRKIRSAFKKAAANPSAANFLISNAAPKAVRSLVEGISKRLMKRGIRFVDASRGGSQLREALDAALARQAGESASKLKLAGRIGNKVAKALPAVGMGVSAALAVPRIAAAAEDDRAYEGMMLSLGEDPRGLMGLSVAREVTIIAGEEAGGEAGGWGGAALGAGVTWETGPGVLVGTIGGAIVFGFAGDAAGGWVAEEMFDSAADDLYEQQFGDGSLDTGGDDWEPSYYP